MPVSVPTFIKQAWAAVGTKFTIPDNANPTTGRAGWDQGFSPINLTPVAAGGIPPFGQDMNGVLYDLSQAIQYVQSGVSFPFNQDFATAIGGYEIGAIVSDASDNSLMWVNGTASNVAFPAGWTSFAIKDPTESLRGVPLKASPSDAHAFLDDSKMLTPAMLAAALAYDPGHTPQINDTFPIWGGRLLLKIGQATGGSTTSGSGVYTYPVAFPNQVLLVALFDEASQTPFPQIASDQSANTRTSFAYRWNGGALGLFSYLAIGY